MAYFGGGRARHTCKMECGKAPKTQFALFISFHLLGTAALNHVGLQLGYPDLDLPFRNEAQESMAIL